ncbi:hypothetical protein BS47DRAFT_1363923 [Hydnum rufescens UP504]|uniref:DUF4100 domain-containing protein n=1 Tax=Hydnum rufescens UP504 TaxID=1448309 RepID=A0A9P6AUX7_9AGAM|nr:hypothetical protein BS47DRAFT_1363923 [Hydnum rufescens UP504]
MLKKGWPSSATIQDPSRVQHLAKKGHLPKSSSKLLIAHKKSKAKKSYYKHKSDSDSSSSSSSDSSDDESPAKEPESDSDSEVPAVVHHKAPVIPTIRNVVDQVGELARSFDEMKIHFARSLPNDNPHPNSNQVHPQTSSPATYPNNYPLGMPQNQYMNKSAEGSGNNLVCWFCDKVGTHNVGMKNCPDAQAMIRQNLIKYSIEGQLVKMDGSRLPQGIPGQGGFKQAIIDEIKRQLWPFSIPRMSLCNRSRLQGLSSSQAGEAKCLIYANGRTSQGTQMEIPPQNLAKPNSENCPKHPAEPTAAPKVNPVPERKQVIENVPAPPTNTPFLNARKPESGILPAETLKQPPSIQPPPIHVPQPIVEIKETAPPQAWKDNIPQEDIEMGFDAPEKKIPKQAPAFQFTTDLQDACEDKDVAEKVLDQMIEISLGDFLGTAIGPAKIPASSTAYQDAQELENAECLDSSDEEPMYKDIYPPGQQHPLKWLYKSHMLKAK